MDLLCFGIFCQRTLQLNLHILIIISFAFDQTSDDVMQTLSSVAKDHAELSH